MLKCYLLDNSRKHRVFNYIEQSLHKEELESAVLENIDVSIKYLEQGGADRLGDFYIAAKLSILKILD